MSVKRRIYFGISSIICIIMNILTAINADKIIDLVIDSFKEVYAAFPQTFQDRAIGLITKSGPAIIIILSIISIFASAVVLYFAIKDKLVKYKVEVVVLSAVTLFTANSIFVLLLSIANIIVIATAKRVRVCDFKEKSEKKDIPKLMKDAVDWDGIVLGVLLLLIYFSRVILSKLIFNDQKVNLVITIIYNIVMITLCILVFRFTLKRDFKIFKDNIKAYVRFILPRLGIMYIVFVVVNLIAILITKNGTSANQQMLEALPNYYVIPAAIIFAPIVEELLFRGVFRKFIRKDTIFIIVSGIAFGLLHAISEASILNVIVMMVPYSLLGCFFAYMYTKTNNIWTNITCHAIWNLLASLFMIFM